MFIQPTSVCFLLCFIFLFDNFIVFMQTHYNTQIVCMFSVIAFPCTFQCFVIVLHCNPGYSVTSKDM